MFKTKCYKGGGKHRYESVYDEVPNPDLKDRDFNFKGCGLREVLVLKKYVKHVCKWCGKEIDRKEC